MPVAKIVHELPWRVRLRAPDLVGHHAACERIANELSQEPGAFRVSVQPMTGSVLIESEEEQLDAIALCKRLSTLVEEERDENGKHLVCHEPLEGPTKIARAVAHSFAQLNDNLRRSLDDRADLASLLPVVFAMGGLADVLTSKRLPTPPWFNLIWWSMRSFMTFNAEAVAEERRNGNGFLDEDERLIDPDHNGTGPANTQ